MSSHKTFALVSCVVVASLMAFQGPAFGSLVDQYLLSDNPITPGTTILNDTSGYTTLVNMQYRSGSTTATTLYPDTGPWGHGSSVHFGLLNTTSTTNGINDRANSTAAMPATNSAYALCQSGCTVELCFKVDTGADTMGGNNLFAVRPDQPSGLADQRRLQLVYREQRQRHRPQLRD